MYRWLVVLVALLLTACGLKPPDPCADTSPLQVDPQVKEACEAMETGDGGEFVCVTPASSEPSYSICVPDNYDNNFWWVPLTQESIPLSSVDHRDCTPAASYQAWASPEMHQREPDYICPNGGIPYKSPDGEAFAIKEYTVELDYYRVLPGLGWTSVSMNEVATVQPGVFSVYCPKGVLCVSAMENCFCKCESDADCSAMTQAEAVCELGMCFYVDEPAAPDPLISGPPAYGLEAWSDGLEVDEDRITMTPAFFSVLVPGAFRDDQSFDSVGQIEHCGRVSLCAHLGLDVGDMLVADPEAVDALLGGRSVDVEVIHADGSDRTLTVTIDFGSGK